jgi:hypothetical protein
MLFFFFDLALERAADLAREEEDFWGFAIWGEC